MSGKQYSLDSRMDIVSTMASSAEGEAAGEHETSENGQTSSGWDQKSGAGVGRNLTPAECGVLERMLKNVSNVRTNCINKLPKDIVPF